MTGVLFYVKIVSFTIQTGYQVREYYSTHYVNHMSNTIDFPLKSEGHFNFLWIYAFQGGHLAQKTTFI